MYKHLYTIIIEKIQQLLPSISLKTISGKSISQCIELENPSVTSEQSSAAISVSSHDACNKKAPNFVVKPVLGRLKRKSTAIEEVHNDSNNTSKAPKITEKPVINAGSILSDVSDEATYSKKSVMKSDIVEQFGSSIGATYKNKQSLTTGSNESDQMIGASTVISLDKLHSESIARSPKRDENNSSVVNENVSPKSTVNVSISSTETNLIENQFLPIYNFPCFSVGLVAFCF